MEQLIEFYLKNSEAATSIPMSILPVYPAFSMAVEIRFSAEIIHQLARIYNEKKNLI